MRIKTFTIDMAAVGDARFIDQSPKAIAARADSYRRKAINDAIEALSKDCPRGCARRFCEHRINEAEDIRESIERGFYCLKCAEWHYGESIHA